MILAEFDTPHFSFIALGSTREHAFELLRAAWAKHIENDTEGAALANYVEWYADAITYNPIGVGTVLRDGEPLIETATEETR